MLIAAVFVALGIGAGFSFSNASNELGGAAIALICTALIILVPLFFVAAVIIKATTSFASRFIVLREAGVLESLRAGWHLFRANLGNVLIMMVLLFALSLVWGIVTGLLGLVSGGLLGAAIGFGVYALTQSGVAGILAALPGLLVTIVFLSVLGGIFVAFIETVWTLMYRQLVDRPAQATPDYSPVPVG
jgi:hypothetical protein